jgi:quinoprotein glucose dehydrogenase
VPDSLRAEALAALSEWPNPSGRDRIVSLWRPLPPRPREVAEREIASRLKVIFPKAPELVQLAALDAIQKLQMTKAETTLLSLVRGDSPMSVRQKALNTLADFKSKRLDQALSFADQSAEPALASEARLVRARLNPAAAAGELGRVLESGNTREKQQVLTTVGRIGSPAFSPLMQTQLQKLLIGQIPRELELDVLDAGAKIGAPELLAMVQKFEAGRPKDNMGPFREALHGGDAEAGRVVFLERAEVSCARCHMIGLEGGQAGPKLTGIGSKQSREYLLESILFPNKDLAKGFENVLVLMNDGTSVAGTVDKEDAKELVINSPEDGEVRVKKADIKSRQKALSGMPEEFRQILTKQDLRNLVEFLASLK